MKFGIIYKILNIITNKVYIGRTTQNIHKRWLNHISRSNIKEKNKTFLHNSMKKYGKQNFIIEKIDTANSLEDLCNKEKYWANFYNSYIPHGYNMIECGNISEEEYNKKILKTSKKYKFISPKDEIIEIENLSKFCEKNNLDKCHMYKLSKGLRKNHIGWRNYNKIVPFTIIQDNESEYKIYWCRGNITRFISEYKLSIDLNQFYHFIRSGKKELGKYKIVSRYIPETI